MSTYQLINSSTPYKYEIIMEIYQSAPTLIPTKNLFSTAPANYSEI